MLTRITSIASSLMIATLWLGCPEGDCPCEEDDDFECPDDDATGDDDTADDDTADDDTAAVLAITDLTVEASEACTLVAVVRWTTNLEASGAVEFGHDEIYESVVDYGGWGTEHEVVVVGMHPEDTYVLRAVSSSEDGQEVRSDSQAFATGAMPEPWQPLTVDVHDPARAQQGWTITNLSLDFETPTYAVMFDMQGLPVWYHYHGDAGRSDVVPKLVDGDHVLIGPGVPTGSHPIVVDLAGNVLWEGPEQDLGFVDGGLHHVFHELSTGDYMFVEYTSIGGDMGDTIVVLDDDLQEVWSWCSFDHMAEHPSWVHTNSVWVDEANDLLYANSYQMDQLFKIDRMTGDILWTLGEDCDFDADPLAPEPWPEHAHSVSVLEDGHVLFYDNGLSTRGYSRVVEYAVDETDWEVEIVWEYPGLIADDLWWCGAWGSAQRLDNGNTLINAGAGPTTPAETLSRTFEVTEDGDIVWQVWWYQDDDVETGAYAAERVEAIAQRLTDDADGDGSPYTEDCDDSNAAIYPGALDVNDGLDNDCDGEADVTLLSWAEAKLTGESSNDRAGASVAAAGDVDGDGNMDLLVGAWFEDTGGEDAGAAYVVLGPVSGTQSLSTAEAKLTGEAAGDMVSRITGAGDMNGDGYDDILVCAQKEDTGGVDAGAAYLVLSPVTGTVSLSTAEAKLTGEFAGDGIMRAVPVGDVDGDGHPDILVGAPEEDTGGSRAGAAYLVLGPVSGTSSLSMAEAKLTGEYEDDLTGAFLAGPGDVNGDGYADLVVGDHYGSYGGADTGAAFLVHGPITGEFTVSSVAAGSFIGNVISGKTGMVGLAGDMNGDSIVDVLATAFGETCGTTYLLHSPISGTLGPSMADAAIEVGAESADGLGDVNGDGSNDLLVGTTEDSYVYFGPVSGELGPEDADMVLRAEDPGDNAGFRVAGPGDVNGDGHADILIGAKTESSVGPNAGAVYLVLGAATGP